MTLTQRIARLEDAHRALHARHEALAIMCRMMLPLISASPSVKHELTTRAYDVMNELMEQHALDAEFQAHARKAMDELTKSVLVQI
jgi:recombinational DNA repair protein (RecF pathway)